MKTLPASHTGLPCPWRTALFLLCALPAFLAGREAHAQGFEVIDGRAPQEISEVSRLYLEGELVATFTLDADHPQVRVHIPTTPGRNEYTYTLCGEIVIRNPAGKTETHEVSSWGHLHNPDDRVFEALGADDFTDFYLADPNDPEATDHVRGRANSCAVATS